MKFYGSYFPFQIWLAFIPSVIQPTAIASFTHKDRELKVRTTAYTHTESDHLEYRNKTALGTTLRYSQNYTSAASDWSRYPVGTEFRIRGLNRHFVIDDYGRALVGRDTIDLYFPSKAEMNRWGVQNVDIIITKYGDFEKSREILSQRVHHEHCLQMLTDIDANFQKGRTEIYQAMPRIPNEIDPILMAAASVPKKDWNRPAPEILPNPKQSSPKETKIAGFKSRVPIESPNLLVDSQNTFETVSLINEGLNPTEKVDMQVRITAKNANPPYQPIRKLRKFRPILSKP